MAARCALVVRGRPRALDAGAAPVALNDPLGTPSRRAGTVVSIEALSPGILQVVVALSRRLDHRPGQHVRVALGHLPPRDYCPTLRVDGRAELNEIVLHVRRGDGRVAHALESGGIGRGDLARVQGPFGDGPHRPGSGRLVLASCGAGFAPIWAIARAARCIEPDRPLALVAGASDGADLYMREALAWLAGTGIADLTLCASAGGAAGGVSPGRVTGHLPPLRPDDVVHAAGPPAMVAAVAALARAAGARCHPLSFAASDSAAPRRPTLVGL